MINIQAPTTLDSRGNLSIHAQQGANILIEFFNDANAPVDMTGRTVVFETQNSIRITLVAGTNSNEMILPILQGDLDAVLNKVTNFVVLDETDAVHELLWQGQITVRGWAD